MPRNVHVEPLCTLHIEEQAVELVERKGLGHPVSIADGVSESVSRALCRVVPRRIREDPPSQHRRDPGRRRSLGT